MRPPFDAVIFDLDGTLVATDRFWPDAARAGALRAFAELGLDREPPPTEVWMGMVGLPLEQGFDAAFADLAPDDRAHLLACCVEEEHRLLDEGRAGLLPGTLEALEHLSAAGVRMGIASNCSQAYLDAMLEGMGLARWIEQGRCLESPRIFDKADMVEDLLTTFGTRSCVMVGDRTGDRDAAWANGIPHVHLARGYAAVGERVEAEAVLEGLDRFVGLLAGRTRALDALLEGLELPTRGATLGVTGEVLSGRTLLARDLARRLEARGADVEVVATHDYLRASWEPDPDPDPLREVPRALDLEPLLERLAGPPGPGAVRILEGVGLPHPRLFTHLDRQVWLDVPQVVAERRARGRDGRLGGPAAVERALTRWLPLDRALERAFPPGPRGPVLDGTNPMDPAPFGPQGA